MKTTKITKLLTLAFCAIAFAFATSCEGPQGPPGTSGTDGAAGSDGTNGVDGNVTCLSCHNTDTKDLIAADFNASQHKAGDVAVDYAGGRGSCAECHSHEGYLEFALTGDVAADIANPQAWECSTCHAIHTDFAADDYAFRLGDPVVLLANGSPTIDGGNNNTCINCHQSRRDYNDYDDETADATYTRTFTGDDANIYDAHVAFGPAGSKTYFAAGSAGNVNDSLIVVYDVPLASHAYISSSHAGPHHGPQGQVWAGLGGFADGVPFGPHEAGCVACHMGPASGHSFWPEEGNCAVCHATDKIPGLDATADRIAAAGAALELIGAVHFDTEDGAFHPMYASLARDDFKAWWDFMVILEDRSNGAHNPVYVEALLSSIETQLGI